ncbi:MAG: beta-lactamase family protein [Chlorobia bacterium]|nr:beta-lactamase family protein [Fimbriimonadaceae bacterium]
MLKVAFAGLLAAIGQVVQADRVDDYVRAELNRQRIPGLALGIVRNGKLIKSAGYGIADLDNDVRVTPDTVFEVASITKQFTATLIMMLVEERKLSLDDKINAHLPNPPDKWKDITLRNLLNHTGGLARLGDDFKTLVRLLNISTESMYAAAREDAMLAAPGEAWNYSDVGFFLLGMIIEKVTGKKYEDALKERILTPLGMTSSRMVDQMRPYKKLAKGYTITSGPEVKGVPTVVNIRRVSQRGMASHYGLFSTVGDLAKWDTALYTNSPLKQETLRQMWTRTTLKSGEKVPYGFGWELGARRGYEYVYHGGITGTKIFRIPELKLTVIVLTNLGWSTASTSIGADTSKIVREIAGIVEQKFRLEPLADADPVYIAKARAAFEALGKGQVPKEVFSENGVSFVTPYLARLAADVVPVGQIRKVELLERKVNGKVQTHFYRFTGAKGAQVFSMDFDGEGKIDEIWVDG